MRSNLKKSCCQIFMFPYHIYLCTHTHTKKNSTKFVWLNFFVTTCFFTKNLLQQQKKFVSTLLSQNCINKMYCKFVSHNFLVKVFALNYPVPQEWLQIFCQTFCHQKFPVRVCLSVCLSVSATKILPLSEVKQSLGWKS